MINILIEGMTESKGGKEAFIINYFRVMDKSRYSFSFIAYDEKIAYQEELESLGAKIVKLRDRKDGLFAYRRDLNEMFKNNHYDVLWANKTTLSSCEILEIAKKNGVPLRIVHSHSSSNMGGKLTYLLHSINKRRLKNWANEFFACSDSAAKWFYGNDNYVLIKNGIDIKKFEFDEDKRKEIRNSLGLNENIVIGHIGRFGVEKNHKKLIDVFDCVHKMNDKTKLVLCGDGEKRADIESQIRELNLEDSVILMGTISNVNELVQAMDLIVMPSLFEGLPFVLIEAQASGLRCVVSDTVSEESNLLGYNEFLPLDMSNQEWGKVVLENACINDDRSLAAKRIKNLGYDIFDCVDKVENIISDYIDK